MADEMHDRPWEELERLVEAERAERVEAFLDALPAGEATRVVSRLDSDDQERLLTTIDPQSAADLIEQMPDSQAADLFERLEPEAAAAIVEELPSDEQADLLGDLDRADAEAILARMAPEGARDARELAQYPDDVAGGLMIKEFLAYPQDFSVADVVADMQANGEQVPEPLATRPFSGKFLVRVPPHVHRDSALPFADPAEAYHDYDVQYAYVTDEESRLVGVLRLRDLLLARRAQPISALMIREPQTVLDTATLDELRGFFDRYPFFGVPAVNAIGTLVGVVRRAAVEEALADRSDSDYRKSQGIVGGEELRTMPLLLRSRRRLAWLSVNIVLNIMAASVIAFYQETLAAVIALAVFLPIISDMSGCSGNQADAVSMR